jgi:hypothetical protein
MPRRSTSIPKRLDRFDGKLERASEHDVLTGRRLSASRGGRRSADAASPARREATAGRCRYSTGMTETDIRELIIVGGGPAGYTAALCSARELRPLVIEAFNGAVAPDHERRRELPGIFGRRAGPAMMRTPCAGRRFGAEFSPTTSHASTSLRLVSHPPATTSIWRRR